METPYNENGFWYETARRERANRKIIERWLAKRPRVEEVSADASP